ncbi:Extradiol ring-cleavage dioxygenase, class III enzyme, subunit B [Biscogniauxia marginata]|nr:Extradiol ring-cleavage dioxygenase, class III enzyme, subunit B [Biscogniauxia marginata]
MAVGKQEEEPMAPVHFFSHGSTMMLGEESVSAAYWKKMGDEALAHGIEHVIIMGAHWSTTLPGVLVSTNPAPAKSPVAYVHPSKYVPYALQPDLSHAPRILALLSASGIPCRADPTFDWIHDTYLVLVRMFPGGCPPTTVVSANARYDPHLHASVGAALRPLRARGARTLLLGSGGSVHNLYRNVWGPMLRHRDNFAQPTPPEPWALGFRHEVVSCFCPGHEEEDVPRGEAAAGGRRVIRGTRPAGGPLLRRKVVSLMKHPLYRDAHATDDHFMAALFVAGLCGDKADEGMMGEMGAEDWELTNMCNSQFTLGSWD